MSTSTLVAVTVPLSEYLERAYRPDCEWIEGEVRERNVGEQPHASVQGCLAHIFRLKGAEWQVWALPEQRVQTSAEHYRVADICVVSRHVGPEPIVHTPPLLCIEILSRDDRMTDMQERVDDYLGMGVATVWVIDPRRRKAFVADRVGIKEAFPELTLPGTAIVVRVAEVFAELDQLEGKT